MATHTPPVKLQDSNEEQRTRHAVEHHMRGCEQKGPGIPSRASSLRSGSRHRREQTNASSAQPAPPLAMNKLTMTLDGKMEWSGPDAPEGVQSLFMYTLNMAHEKQLAQEKHLAEEAEARSKSLGRHRRRGRSVHQQNKGAPLDSVPELEEHVAADLSDDDFADEDVPAQRSFESATGPITTQQRESTCIQQNSELFDRAHRVVSRERDSFVRDSSAYDLDGFLREEPDDDLTAVPPMEAHLRPHSPPERRSDTRFPILDKTIEPVQRTRELPDSAKDTSSSRKHFSLKGKGKAIITPITTADDGEMHAGCGGNSRKIFSLTRRPSRAALPTRLKHSNSNSNGNSNAHNVNT
ncbi:hypothetical protein ACN47E_003505 [Coniothyrium glycines]